MSKKDKVGYTLSDQKGIALPEEQIRLILRAADEIIYKAGRTMLAKILKGSKDKTILQNSLDRCPAYGSFKHFTMEEITGRIDWMIWHEYLDIDYNGRLPMIVFSEGGWEVYKPQYAKELLDKMRNVGEEDSESLIQQLKTTNREVVTLILREISESGNSKLTNFLLKWEAVEVKKVRAMIKEAISNLE